MRATRSRATRLIAALLALALVAAACGRDEDDTEAGSGEPTADDGGDGTADDGDDAGTGSGGATSLDEGGFGDLEGLCSEGDGEPSVATETGLSDDEIRVGVLSDKGATVAPGLNEEMYDAAVAFAAWCNEHGGIGGRELVVADRDAKLFEYSDAVEAACREDFALVGGGAVFDEDPDDIRVGCDLPNIAGYVVSARGRVADLQVQPVPNPIYQLTVGHYQRLGELYPDAVQRVAVLTGDLPATRLVGDQSREAMELLGYDVTYYQEYSSAGENPWRNFVAQMRDADVGILEFIGQPLNLVELNKAMDIEGWYPEAVVLQTNFYDENYVAEAGDISGNALIRSAYHPLEMAEDNKATQDYLDLMERYNPSGKIALLGMQTTSALLLFAEAVKSCGTDLSRECLLEAAADRTGWTGGGLHADQPPGNVTPGACFLFLEVEADGFVYSEELTDPDEGIFNCEGDNVIELENDYGVPRPTS
jgi:ABC-type branched-subunit amino acid transport system substrate-binding protein